MTHESLTNSDWDDLIQPFGGPEGLTKSAKKANLKVRWRKGKVESGEVYLRLILKYCYGKSLRATAAWAASVDIADISNVALLKRLNTSGPWLTMLIGQLLAASLPKVLHGRLIRLVDGTTVRKAKAKKANSLWRIHSAFNLPAERFDFFELTDEKTGERLDMAPVVPGEIRIADRAYLQPDRMAAVIAAGGDLVVRAAWTNARWVNKNGELVDLVKVLRKGTKHGRIDTPIWIQRKNGEVIPVRLVACMKPKDKAEAAEKRILAEALKKKREVLPGTLEAAKWVILVTTLRKEHFSTGDVLALYRLRWRIELAFKRLKSLIGLKSPPGEKECSARPWILAHLLILLAIEPLASELDDSPRWKQAA